MNLERKPKLIVFDLDYTLWPFWVDTHVSLPLRRNSIGNVVDAAGRKVPYYPEVPTVLEHLKAQGYTLAVASRTGEIRGANQALQLFNWDKYFTYKEIYPGCKVNHFNQFRKISGIQFQDMLFFDDEYRNIRDLEAQGVTSVLVDDGISFAVVEEGLKAFSSRTS
ncbi:magnesium-dependent phosphatase 1-like isoform X2 [Schistocerca americana]|uniref:magnesium-dependent phosphatase 1-like isoform X2 n=1 Tax=Schistocerca americana TaxID=7009 RepID=UPI001F4F91D7|nr:magnesium-dependent phosphatase 1-like isoform X2 [Schistocerca americana]